MIKTYPFQSVFDCQFAIKISAFIFLIFIAFFAQNSASFAQFTPQEDQVIRNQQESLERENREREFQRIRKEREQMKKPEEEESLGDQEEAIKSGKCFEIKTIELIGADSLSKREKSKITKPFLNECFNNLTFSKLVKSVTSNYQEAGYVTVQVSIPKQNIKEGEIKLQVIEGKIHDVILYENKFTDKMQEFTAFGQTQNQNLNLNDINQGLYQINRLRSNNAKMKIAPAQEVGFSDVIISNEKEFPVFAEIGYDNLGNKFTGERKTEFSGTIDNALSLNDQININYSANLEDSNEKRDFRSFSGAISIPYKYNLFSYDYSRTTYRGQSAGISNILTTEGYGYRNNLSVDRVLFNNIDYRIATNLSLTTKESGTILNNVALDSHKRKLTTGNLAFSLSKFFKNGANLYVKPQYVRGLKILNAQQDENDLTAGTPRAQFEIYELYANLSKRFEIPQIYFPLTFAVEMNSQFSQDTLFGSEQFSVGGYNSVRGFKENYITGDNGYYFRNKVSVNLGQIFAPLLNQKIGKIETKDPVLVADSLAEPESKPVDNSVKTSEETKNKFNFSQKISSILYQTRLEPFYDYGYTRENFRGDSGHLSGAGLKAAYSGKNFDASLTYSWAIQKSQFITAEEKENKMLYFELSLKCC